MMSSSRAVHTASPAASPAAGWRVGAAKRLLPTGTVGTPLMGWAQPTHVQQGVALPLYARAAVFSAESPAAPTAESVAVVLIDYSSTSGVLRRAVEARLALSDCPHLVGDRLVVSATHTHSGPGGYLDGLLFRVVNPYEEALVGQAAAAIAEAVEAAYRSRCRAVVRRGEDEIPATEPIAFSRSTAAHLANPDSPHAGRRSEPDELIDRVQQVIWAADESGRPIATWALFGCHGTCVHADRFLVHPDHKGLAGARLESAWAAEGVEMVALFAQACAGDVSPNYREDRARGVTIAHWDDDYEAADQVAAAQVRSWWRAWRRGGEPLAPRVHAAIRFHEFHDSSVPPSCADGVDGRRTGAPLLGMAMLAGTAEGKGPFYGMRGALGALSRRRAAKSAAAHPAGAGHTALATQSAKVPALELGVVSQGRTALRIPVPWWRHIPPVDGFARGLRSALGNADRGAGWLETRLPVQLVVLGDWAAIALPFEPTTQAGRRLRADVLSDGARHGIARSCVLGYANDYAGYLTTPEEYQVQAYEGGFTLFGRWQLDATRSVARALTAEI